MQFHHSINPKMNEQILKSLYLLVGNMRVYVFNLPDIFKFHNDKHLGICIANKQLQMQICINFGTISYNFQTLYTMNS